MNQLIGKRLGRYAIQQEIGRGGMARVYRALDTRLHRPVALKVMAPHLNADSEYLRRFVREARLAAKLHHPGIVSVYDVDEQEGLRYIAMEFIEGRSLYSVLKEHGAIGLGYAVSILESVGQALDYAHQKGAIHRDVKPHNVLIALDGRVLLTDFGIALPLDGGRERLTRTGIFMGTPEYISPEQIESRYVDGRSDLYSLGIVAYEIVTGRVPFVGTTPQLIAAHAQTPPPLPGSLVPTLPRELDPVFARILAKDPQSRFPNGGAMVDALRRVARRYGIEVASTADIASLAVMGGTSVGRETIRGPEGSMDPTPLAAEPPLAVRRAEPPVEPGSGAPAYAAGAPRVGEPPAPPEMQSASESSEYSEPGRDYPAPHPYPEAAAVAGPEKNQPRRLKPVALWMGVVVIIGLVIVAVVASFFRGCGVVALPPTAASSPTLLPTPTATDASTPEPIPTPAPLVITTVATTEVPPPPTDTPVPPPPTETPIPPPTSTPIPPPTMTPLPPTPTPTEPPTPTETPTPTGTPEEYPPPARSPLTGTPEEYPPPARSPATETPGTYPLSVRLSPEGREGPFRFAGG